ncbi:MAG: tyrosine-type recombinase/integrase [Hyphomicrobiales bacterium]|nr:tyrosine-type recombinase/integrase [Hyphomicrobiales bacterium]
MTDAVKIPLKYVYEDRDARGNVRRYFWRGRGHRKIRLREEPPSDAFMEEYRAARDGAAPVKPAPLRPVDGSLRAWCADFYRSAEFSRLAKNTRDQRRRALDAVCLEPVRRDAPGVIGDLPAASMPEHVVRVIRDRKLATPNAANDWLKALRALFEWAKASGRTRRNPAAGVPYISVVTEGHHTWTAADMAAFVARHPRGTPARLAYELFRSTGARISDAAVFGRQHIYGAALRWRPKKGSTKKLKLIELPIMPDLAAEIDRMPPGQMTFIVSAFGKPYTEKGLGNKMRQWCNEAGLPHCSAHGIRKADACEAAEAGATASQLQAMFGWDSLKEAEKYVRAADQKKLAADAVALIKSKR